MLTGDSPDVLFPFLDSQSTRHDFVTYALKIRYAKIDGTDSPATRE